MECMKECCCCKGCRPTYTLNFYREYLKKAKQYVAEKGFVNAYSVLTACNQIAKEVYRELEPEYKSYTKIESVITNTERVERLYSIFCIFVDSYEVVMMEGENEQ